MKIRNQILKKYFKMWKKNKLIIFKILFCKKKNNKELSVVKVV